MRISALPAFLVSAFYLFANEPAAGQASAEQAQTPNVAIADHVAEASQRFGLPESWIYAVMRSESAGRIDAVSPAGAMGLMQLMPGTWARQRARFALGSDPFDPRDNIMAGTSYLREMYDTYGGYGMLAAYNAGPGRYEDWRDRGRPLPAETHAYVAKITPALHGASAATVAASAYPVQPVRLSWTHSPLFAAQSANNDNASGSFATAAPPNPAGDSNAPPGGLFASVLGSRPQ